MYVDDVVNITGYTWFGYNRAVTNVGVNKASGGVGWLVNNALFVNYVITVSDMSYEGIICLICMNCVLLCLNPFVCQ